MEITVPMAFIDGKKLALPMDHSHIALRTQFHLHGTHENIMIFLVAGMSETVHTHDLMVFVVFIVCLSIICAMR